MRVPKRVIILVQLRDDASLKILFREILDDIVPIGKSIDVPPVTVTHLSIDYLDKNGPLLHLKLLLIFFLILEHHLHAHRDVLLEFLRNEVQFDALR